MKREIYAKLLEWKSRKGHKPLVLDGARQVGKTYILKEFGVREYKNVSYVNLDKDAVAKSVFDPDHDIKRIIRTLSAYTGVDIVPGDTLIIIDEIQESSAALGCLKYFKEEFPQYDVAVAGSLLGISIHEDQSFPVGMVEFVRMFPMSLLEFLNATGNEKLTELLLNHDWESVNILSQQYTELLRQYYYVGGMPEAVAGYIAGKGLKAVRQIQKDILAGYRRDFSKHAPNKDVPRIEMVWDSLPSHLAKENKKFIYGALRKGGRAKEFEMAISWLRDAGLIYKVHRVSKIEYPLSFYEDFDVFKVFPLDVGLLGAMTDVPASQMLVGNNVFKEFKGAFTECYVNEQLARVQIPVFYYSSNESEVEIDFAVQTENRVIPIEVKAEENVKSKSLKTYIDKYPELKGLRISMLNYVDQGWMENLPLYAIEGYFSQ
jgi:predicted AAA+ superfamily ATPase